MDVDIVFEPDDARGAESVSEFGGIVVAPYAEGGDVGVY